MNTETNIPVAVIGAGPVGLAAAAHLLEQGLEPIVFERGSQAATAVRQWGHVRVFTPWRYLIDAAAQRLLETAGWTPPPAEELPTGHEIVDRYLVPLSELSSISSRLVTNAKVTAVTRDGISKIQSSGREDAGYLVHWTDEEGQPHQTNVSAVIDASGTWFDPNPIGIDGLPVPGEREAADSIAYGIPDVLGQDRVTYAGKRVLVVGGGHSAANVALDLAALQKQDNKTQVIWGVRRPSIANLVGGGADDELPARGQLGLNAKQMLNEGAVSLVAPYRIDRIETAEDVLIVHGRQDGKPVQHTVDRIIAATGFRPDVEMHRELRVELDPMLEAPPQLAPLIDPNLHSCGTVPPHGVVELGHPEPGFFIVGMKSYGRAPTFLMLTGYEQVRSITAELAGDHDAARRVELSLPETGVCSSDSSGSCCAPQSKSACCGPAPKPATVQHDEDIADGKHAQACC